MKVGVTGTQRGMTDAQCVSFGEFIGFDGINELHHGDCIGGDAQMHDITREKRPDVRIIVHPPLVQSKEAFKLGDITLSPRDYLQRDRNIVDATDVLVACPYEPVDRQRSGTWYTVRYARRQGKQVWVILPSGEIRE